MAEWSSLRTSYHTGISPPIMIREETDDRETDGRVEGNTKDEAKRRTAQKFLREHHHARAQ